MAGYNGYSMSNNAVDAYRTGKKPMSAWTKTEIISAIETALDDGELVLRVNPGLFKQVPAATLRNAVLRYSEWHHTSSYYNRTDFYELDIDRLEMYTETDLRQMINKKPVKKEQEPGTKAICHYLEWTGTRKHPRAIEHTDEGIIRGNWFFLPDGTKKSVNANGFYIIKRLGRVK